jgi:hypothetical protein
MRLGICHEKPELLRADGKPWLQDSGRAPLDPCRESTAYGPPPRWLPFWIRIQIEDNSREVFSIVISILRGDTKLHSMHALKRGCETGSHEDPKWISLGTDIGAVIDGLRHGSHTDSVNKTMKTVIARHMQQLRADILERWHQLPGCSSLCT